MLPIIFSVAGPELTARERAFFKSANPAGYIIFNRNVTGRAQVRRLTDELRALSGRDRLPILVDQEGGRVQVLGAPPGFVPEALADVIGRNRNPEFEPLPAAARFGVAFGHDHEAGLRAAYLNARVTGRMLFECGITVNCAPVLDLPVSGAHDVIGDRAFGDDIEMVEVLGRFVMDGFAEEGVVPIIKHIPGHGRAMADSHLSLPRVDAPIDVLEATDFAPFLALGDAPMAMTAHVLYTAIDAHHPATVSAQVIAQVIRGFCRFDGLLVTDALEMAALSGSLAERARASLAAGCDLALYCSGQLEAMEAIAASLPGMDGEAARRLDAAMQFAKVPDRDAPSAKVMAAERDLILRQTGAMG